MDHQPNDLGHLVQAPANLRAGTLRILDATTDICAGKLEAKGLPSDTMRKDLARVRRLVAALPDAFPSPQIRIAADGSVTMNWRGKMEIDLLVTVAGDTLTIDFPGSGSPSSELNALRGSDDLPPVLMESLCDIYAYRPDERGALNPRRPTR